MKDFVYPAVVNYSESEQVFTMFFPDLSIVTDGDNVEEVYSRGKSYLNRYIELVVKNDLEINEPSTYADITKKYPNDLIILVECKLNDKNVAV